MSGQMTLLFDILSFAGPAEYPIGDERGESDALSLYVGKVTFCFE